MIRRQSAGGQVQVRKMQTSAAIAVNLGIVHVALVHAWGRRRDLAASHMQKTKQAALPAVAHAQLCQLSHCRSKSQCSHSYSERTPR